MAHAGLRSPGRTRAQGIQRWNARSSVGVLVFLSAAAALISGFSASWNIVLRDGNRHRPPSTRSSWALSDEWTYPKYSTHTCISQRFDDAWQTATCKFDNICLNTTTLDFEYYQDPAYPDTAIQYSQWGRELHDEFSEHLVHPGHALEDHRKVGWRPVVKRQHFPRPARFVKWADQAQALLQAVPFKYAYNFGHIIFDVLVPLFNMQHLFGIYTPDAQILVLDHHLNHTLKLGIRPEEESDTREALIRRMRNLINTTDPSHSLLRLTWDHDIMWLKQYSMRYMGRGRDLQGTPGLLCFKTVLAGTGFLSRRMSRLEAYPYRQAVVEHIGLREDPQLVPTITLLNKEGRRVVENWREVYDILRHRYKGGTKVQLVDFGTKPNMTVQDQVHLMSETSILLSPCGGLATVLTFLRPGSTAIVMNYWHTEKQRSVQMEDQYYRNIEYLDFQYFPVKPEDYANTTDRPGCELLEGGEHWQDRRYRLSGALVNCNVRLQGKSMQRLIDIVDNAMLRWAAQHGQYNVVASLKDKGRFPSGEPAPTTAKAWGEGGGSQQEAGEQGGSSDGSQQETGEDGGNSEGSRQEAAEEGDSEAGGTTSFGEQDDGVGAGDGEGEGGSVGGGHGEEGEEDVVEVDT